MSVDLLPVNTLMMMKPEEAILQVTGMPLMRIMKLDSGGERMFSKVRKFKPAIRPCMEPVEWTIADSDAFQPIASDPETALPRKKRSPSPGPRMDIDFGAVNRPQQPQNMRFIVKDGVRHVYISSLDELRLRLDLDENREAGVTEGELREGKQETTREKQPVPAVGRQKKRGAAQPSERIQVDEVHVDIDQAKLDRSVYSGSPRRLQGGRNRTPAVEAEARTAAVLRRQDVRDAFGGDIQALNAAIFEQADAGSFEPTELNADVALLIGTLSERLTEDSSKAFLREFADLARDPLREDREPPQTENRFE